MVQKVFWICEAKNGTFHLEKIVRERGALPKEEEMPSESTRQ